MWLGLLIVIFLYLGTGILVNIMNIAKFFIDKDEKED